MVRGAQRRGAGRTGGASPRAKRGLRRSDARPRPHLEPRQGAGTRPAGTRGSEGAGV